MIDRRPRKRRQCTDTFHDHLGALHVRCVLQHDHTGPLEQGRAIAARAYRDECAKRPERDPHVLSGYRTREPSNRTLWLLTGAYR